MLTCPPTRAYTRARVWQHLTSQNINSRSTNQSNNTLHEMPKNGGKQVEGKMRLVVAGSQSASSTLPKRRMSLGWALFSVRPKLGWYILCLTDLWKWHSSCAYYMGQVEHLLLLLFEFYSIT